MVGYSSNLMVLFLVAALQLVTSTSNTCSSKEFKCPDGGCIPNRWLCDGDDDCGDRADEKNCPGFECDWPTGQRYRPYPGDCTKFLQCSPSGAVAISCPAGTYWSQNNTICDTDDSECPDACSSTEFRCHNGRCIRDSYLCDGDDDCRDMTDEKNCNNTCSSSYFKCPDGGCIKNDLLCNGKDDCGDGADENVLNKCDWPTGQKYWPYPGDCTKFMQCAPMGAVAISCPAGTYWSQDNTICDTDDSVCPGVVVPTCGRTNPSYLEIYRGNETDVNEYPWQVALTYGSMCSPEVVPFCGGSIINELWILTAAHCSVRLSTIVVVGEHSWNDTDETTATKRYAIKQIVNHPDFVSVTSGNDIALIKLATPLTFDRENKVAPVCPPALNDLYENVEAIVTGWGRLETGFQSDTLQEVDVPTLTNTECQSYYQGEYTITDNMICAGYPEGGKDSCKRDSGGPLITADGTFYRQIGVVSWGDGCALPGKPGVYARITTQWEWITDTIFPTIWSEPKVTQIKWD